RVCPGRFCFRVSVQANGHLAAVDLLRPVPDYCGVRPARPPPTEVARADAPAERATWTLPPANADTPRGFRIRRRPRGAFCLPAPTEARTLIPMIAITLPDGSRRE